jgi:hypothetical protein
MIYAGIGSRQTPEDILEILFEIGKILGRKNYILRSGGADGADLAFELGCDEVQGKKEIYLPWKKFNKNTSELYSYNEECSTLAEQFHPAWHNCSHGAKLLHTRNICQVLGMNPISDPRPTDFIVCWTMSDLNGGGTSQALRVAHKWNIPVFNIRFEDQLNRFTELYLN